MTDHRTIQRTLFRMQMDPAFAAEVFAGDSLDDLAPADAELLRAADPAGVAADRDGKRKRQLLGNLTMEYVLCTAIAADDLAAAFLSSPEFHRAITDDGCLPEAFGVYAERVAGEAKSSALAALATLGLFLVGARRSQRDQPRLAELELALSPRASLVHLPAGTFELATRIREALDGGRPLPPPVVDDDADEETVLVVAEPRPSPHRLATVTPERPEPPVAAFLERASAPFPRPAQGAFAKGMGASLEELDRFVQSLSEDKVLLRGPL